ncbi:MAG: dihydroorotate dehydrogenase electron transfer subunit [Promethearchaeota archaeon]
MQMKRIKKGWKELKTEIIDSGKCCFCGACACFCDSIKMTDSGPVESGLCAEESTCRDGFGTCYNLCPMTGKDMIPLLLLHKWTSDAREFDPANEFNQPNVRIVAARYAGPKETIKTINGNAAIGLLIAAMRSGMIDGVIMADLKDNKPVIAKTEPDIIKYANNLFFSCYPLSILSKAVNEENLENVGVIGNGCEIRGLRKMQNHPFFDFEMHELITFTLGTFCFFKPRPDKLKALLKSKGVKWSDIEYIQPNSNNFKYLVKNKNHELAIPLQEIFSAAGKICCFSCSDSTASLADISIGSIQAMPDWDMLLIRTEKGRAIFNLAIQNGLLEIKEINNTVNNMLLNITRNKFIFYKINEIKEITGDIKTFVFIAPEIAKSYRPGQFIILWLPDIDFFPMSISKINDDRIEITVRRVGEGTTNLFAKKVGDAIGIRGPYGIGWDLTSNNYLVIGGGIGIAALTTAIDHLIQAGKNVSIVCGARTKDEIFCLKDYEAQKIPSCFVTEDGTSGNEGMATDFIDKILDGNNIENIITCGPEIMMKKVLDIATKRGIPLQASLERFMKCGVGLCGTCCIGKDNDIPICKEGPIFNQVKLKRIPQFGTYKK